MMEIHNRADLKQNEYPEENNLLREMKLCTSLRLDVLFLHANNFHSFNA